MLVPKVILFGLFILSVHCDTVEILANVLKQAISQGTPLTPAGLTGVVAGHLGVSVPTDELKAVIQKGLKKRKSIDSISIDAFKVVKKAFKSNKVMEYSRMLDDWYLSGRMNTAVQNGLLSQDVANRILDTFRPDGLSINPLTVNEINKLVNARRSYDSTAQFLDYTVKNLLTDRTLSSDEKARALVGYLGELNKDHDTHQLVNDFFGPTIPYGY